MKQRDLKTEKARKNVSSEKTDAYVQTLKEMIDARTVFSYDTSTQEQFQKFYQTIENRFPLICQHAEKLVFGSGCFVYCIKGTDAKQNVMLMSHHDVVDATGGWDSDPFCAQIKDGALYGRGSIDTKTPLFAELQAVEELLAEGYDFAGQNIYIGSSNNEEVSGDGMVLARDYFQENNIRFDVILDEGGAITTGMLPGFSGKSAMVAVHEKSRHMYTCKTTLSTKGHGGLAPDNDSAVLRLCRFMKEVSEKKIYHDTFYPEVMATFETHAPYMPFPLSFVFRHLKLFGPVVKKIMAKIPPARAMLSTGISFTTIFAGDKRNPQIRAKEAECTMFIRCIREEDMEQGLLKIKDIAQKYGVEISLLERDYCRPSSFDSEAYHVLEEVMAEDFPDVVTAPFLLTAGTDARRFSEIADNILRFAPIDLDAEQFSSIHGDNEHIYIDNIGQCVCFYKDYIKRMGELRK